MREIMSPADWLRKSGAQRDVIDGLARFTEWRALYEECPRGDWLLGIAERLGAPHVALVRAAVGCARVMVVDEGGEAATVLELAERWSDGRATALEIATATRALESASARAVDPASEAACRAALAVGLGVEDRGVLTSAPAAAAEAVMMESIDCGFELALRWAHDKCAAAVRNAVPWEVFESCVARLGDAP